MPSALPTPCSQARCPEITTERYCQKHRGEKWSGDDRPSAADRGYDARWRKVSKLYRKRHPLCEHCQQKGRTRAADLVDHITPLSAGGKRLDTDNLQALCHHCHNRKTAREQS